ncbi:MAG: GGDEF domain-containing protein [Lachnospiraceae bacterium]|nr:GGDEF domain-containing protein [Lachnospiraceae bacterium]
MKNKRIAVFANGWSNECLKLLLEGIRKRAAENLVDVFVFVTYIYWGESGAQMESNLNLFHLADPEFFDGAILLANTFNSASEGKRIRKIFQDSGIPLLSTEVKMPGVARIATNNYVGVCELAEHLIAEHQVKNVVYVGGIPGNEESAIRQNALEDVLHKHGLTLMDTFLGNFSYRGASEGLELYLNEKKPLPDAFVCANDHMALGIINTLYQHGIEVPKNVIVTGFDKVYEAQTSYPLVATVSRQWDHMGEDAYDLLMELMESPDPSYERILKTHFVPSESCGCRTDEEGRKMRINRVRNLYESFNMSSGMDQFFQTVQIEVAKVESEEDFYEAVKDRFASQIFVGGDYCIMTDPSFFSTDNDESIQRRGGYGEKLNLLLEIRDRKPMEQRIVDTADIYPDYHKDPSKSETFVITPILSRDLSVGYLAVRNKLEVVYNLDFQKWNSNLGTMLYMIRQYIFSQQTNRKLKEIYMSDFLTEMYNRTGCESVLFSYVQSEKEKGNSTILLFIDINSMKKINDLYGHLNGDLAIKATASAMRMSLPEEGWLFGRYGGDEFVAVGACEDENFIDEYRKTFADTMKRISERLKIQFTLSASVGYTIIQPDDEGTIEDFIRYADASMYEQKEIAHRSEIM